MEEKMFGVMLKNLQATDSCIRATEGLQKAFIKQIKINRRQRFINIGLAYMLLATLSEFVSLKEKIRELVNAIKEVTTCEAEEPKAKKKGD